MKRKTAKIISIVLAVITALSICGGALAAVANAASLGNIFGEGVDSIRADEKIQAEVPIDNIAEVPIDNIIESDDTSANLSDNEILLDTTNTNIDEDTPEIEVKSATPYIEETTTEPVTGEKTTYFSGEIPKTSDKKSDSSKETTVIVDIQSDIGKINAIFKGKNNKQTVELEYCEDYNGSPCYIGTATFPNDKYNVTLKADKKKYAIDMKEMIIDFDGTGDAIKIDVNNIKDTDSGVAGFFKNNTFIILVLIASVVFYFVYKKKNSFEAKRQ